MIAGTQRPGPCVIIATYRRPRELARLLDGLQNGALQPAGVIVADNAASDEVRALLSRYSIPSVWLPLPDNPGPGAAWSAGAEHFIQHPFPGAAEFLVFCDDDIVVDRNLLALAAQAFDSQKWDLAAPLLIDNGGNVWGFPEPLDATQRREIRKLFDPVQVLDQFGPGPHRICWATGACLFVSRKAVAEYGLYRTDFFMLGEDLEFSMRIASGNKAVFYPEWVVPHSPLPVEPGCQISSAGRIGEKRKFLALLQNLVYLTFHSPHSRHMGWYLPGNFRRYLKTFGMGMRSWLEILKVFLAGSLLGEPAGGPAGENLRKSLEKSAG